MIFDPVVVQVVSVPLTQHKVSDINLDQIDYFSLKSKSNNIQIDKHRFSKHLRFEFD